VQNYLQPIDDGLPMRPSGSWVAAKLDYLMRYIDIFETSMHSKPWRKRRYIDLFAGPGKCCVEGTKEVYLGSPLLSLTTTYPFTDYIFVDLNDGDVAVLQRRCSASPLRNRVQFYVGDSNIIVKEIVEHILDADKYIPGKWPSLNLAFLDPAGLDLQWETVATLAQANRMDLIIHYSQGGLNRSMSNAFRTDGQTKVDLFFGGTEWREIYEKWGHRRDLHRLLLDHYKEKLQDVGYKEVLRDDQVGNEPLIRNAKSQAPLYRLLFASKHPLGHDFWRKVISRDVYGQKRLF